jgi:hypothetical protein
LFTCYYILNFNGLFLASSARGVQEKGVRK